MVLIVAMGVSGCGKSTIGEAIGNALDIPFIEGDALHPASNIDKMSHGIPLNDEDRWPWLTLIGEKLAMERNHKGVIIACSALKKSYRDLLRQFAGPDLKFVYVHGDKALLEKRMGARTGHFMPTSLLETQLATLEDPRGEQGVVTVDCADSISTSLNTVENYLARDG